MESLQTTSEKSCNDNDETKILLLDNYTLFDIFKRISLNDLCEVAQTCTRFRHVARQVFMTRDESKVYALRIKDLCTKPKYQHKRILTLFGDIIKEVELWNPDGTASVKDIDEIFRLVERYCGETLCGLTILLARYTFPEFAINMLKKVEKLKLLMEDQNYMKLIVSQCQHLVHLELPLRAETLDYSKLNFPNLRSLEHVLDIKNEKKSEVQGFFSRNSSLVNLRTAFLGASSMYDTPRNLRLTFICYWENLNTLDIKFSFCNVINSTDFSTLKMLKTLILHGGELETHNNAELLKNLGSIDTLQTLKIDLISSVEELIDGISRFQSLHTLHISNGTLNLSVLTKLKNRNLINLFFDGFSSAIRNSQALVGVLEHFSQLRFLKLDVFVDVTESTLNRLADFCLLHKRIVKVGIGGFNRCHDYVGNFNNNFMHLVKLETCHYFHCVCPDCVMSRMLTEFMLHNDPTIWEMSSEFQQLLRFVPKINVVNDVAERGIAQMTKYNSSLTYNEDEKQKMIQIVEEHCKRFSRKTKKADLMSQ